MDLNQSNIDIAFLVITRIDIFKPESIPKDIKQIAAL